MTEHRAASTEEQDEAALLAEIDAELAAERRVRRRAPESRTGLVLLIGGAIGWIAALMLLIDKLYLLSHPGAVLGCDINPFISCGSVMVTWQSNAFGIPNMAIGLAGFAIMGATGALLASRTVLPRWYRWATWGGMAFAFAFVHFLAYSAIVVIGALCPWCMVVWAATAPMFFATTAFIIEQERPRLPGGLAGLLRHWVVLTLVWYVLVAAVIAVAFLPQWQAMFGL
ncbi:MAG: vitamin K epoxide reductase family protein [Brachybacterium sp.]|nr:vitamin K epoxide reductase family protein [Brachybacterium sp.]